MRPSLPLAAALVFGFLSSVQARDLTFEERVRAQEAIERIYYSHQIGATRGFEEAVPHAVLEHKVATYLKQSVALEKYWHTTVTPTMLQHELLRIARGTKLPDRLGEIYVALGNDAFVLEECLARPALVDRLARGFFAFDPTIHDAERKEAESLLARLRREGASALDDDPRRSEREAAGASRPAAIREERDGFVLSWIEKTDSDPARETMLSIPKTSWDAWWAGASNDLDPASVRAVATSNALPSPGVGARTQASSLSCTLDGTWDNGILDGRPGPRSEHAAVWTGSEMIVWGGARGTFYPQEGERYDPATDTWTATSMVGAPAGRTFNTAVWTGSVMIVWGGATLVGGEQDFDTGGRYDPATDSWASTSTSSVPAARTMHAAVWTGNRMIVWGGQAGSTYLGDGGRYDPGSDTWTPLASIASPTARRSPSAIWTGSSMIVWGGSDGGDLSTGASYDPVADTWTPTATAGAPIARRYHTAVWTGSRMVIWGGDDSDGNPLDTGGRYDPASDTWTATSTVGVPMGRSAHTAVWTGSRMIVWGGMAGFDYLQTGASYDPSANTWTSISITGAPLERQLHTGVWTGDRMVVWGGFSEGNELNTGGRYDPTTNSWTPTSTGGQPEAREQHTAIWTGTQMVIWGGQGIQTLASGARYDPVVDSWLSVSTTNAPVRRYRHSAIWTGTEMIVWGGAFFQGSSFHYLNSGGRYNPVTDAWTATATSGAPTARWEQTAVWTGSRMILWGGYSDTSGELNTGGRYDPAANTWAATGLTGAPAARRYHGAVWTGSRMIVWGGPSGAAAGTGGRYDPVTDSWSATSIVNAPPGGAFAVTVWTGSRMVAWGGSDFVGGTVYRNTGGRYDPITNTWAQTTTTGAPDGRTLAVGVWVGDRLFVWGGANDTPMNTGATYDPVGDSWTATSMDGVPGPRYGAPAVWTGSFALFWGGSDGAVLSNGGRYAWGQSRDPDGDGYSECDGDCRPLDPAIGPGAIERCNGIDDDCNELIDDDVPPLQPGPSIVEGKSGGSTTLSWAAVPGATTYDVVKGSLATLRSTSGNFTSATIACVANDLAGTSAVDTEVLGAGQGRWFTARVLDACSGVGTYDEAGSSQQGTRDAEIGASGAACP